MPKQQIVTFSGKARCGKDSSVQILKKLLEEGGRKVLAINYADQVKYLARQYLGWDGNKDEKGRTLLQQFGTEKVRTKFPNYWVDAVMNIVKVFEEDFDFVLIGDCRFPNEIEAWRENGYNIISVHVERVGFDNGLTEEQRQHSSEIALDGYRFAEYLIAENLYELEHEITSKVLPLLESDQKLKKSCAICRNAPCDYSKYPCHGCNYQSTEWTPKGYPNDQI